MREKRFGSSDFFAWSLRAMASIFIERTTNGANEKCDLDK
jgi:hypothetical protein